MWDREARKRLRQRPCEQARGHRTLLRSHSVRCCPRDSVSGGEPAVGDDTGSWALGWPVLGHYSDHTQPEQWRCQQSPSALPQALPRARRAKHPGRRHPSKCCHCQGLLLSLTCPRTILANHQKEDVSDFGCDPAGRLRVKGRPRLHSPLGKATLQLWLV